jgi:hypothetical protein
MLEWSALRAATPATAHLSSRASVGRGFLLSVPDKMHFRLRGFSLSEVTTMTDLEMTRLCAEAMFDRLAWEQRLFDYDPLHDDAQAMALMKRFDVLRSSPTTVYTFAHCDEDGTPYYHSNDDLNRAIVECVAKIQADKRA